jgi:tetratricopeptide (TPR) repeat protein
MVAFAAASATRRAETPPDQIAPAETAFSAPASPQVVEDSIVSRSFIWGGAREMIKHHPFGVGIGAFKVRYLSMLTVHLEKSGISTIPGFFKDVNAKEAHCEYLHIWAELGFIGLGLLLYFIFAVFKYFKKIYYPLKEDPFTQCVALGAFSALASVGASAVFGFPFHIIGTSMFCGAALALLVFSEDRLLGAGTLPASLPGSGPRKRSDDGEPKKNKKNKRKKESDAGPTPDMSWKTRWAVVRLSRPVSIAGMAVATLFFILILKFSVDVQMANILMKKGNSYARRATELAAGAEAAERRGESAEAVAYRNGAADFDQQALDLLEQSLKLDPYNGDIHLFRGMFFQKHKETDTAMASYIEARRYYDLPQISLDLGALYFEKGEEHYDQAAKNFIDSMRVYPNYPLPRYNLGLIFYQKAMSLISPEKQGMTDAQATEETAGMLRELENLRKRERGGGSAAIPRPTTRVEIARLLFRESALMFRESININPSLDTAAFKLGITFERLYEIEDDDPAKKLDHIDNALYWYKYTVGVNPSHADAYYNYALALTRKAAVFNNRADAETDPAEARSLRAESAKLSAESRGVFEKVLNVNPSHTLTLNNLGNMYFNDGRIDESIEMYKRALEADPDYLNARLNIALAYMQTGRYAQTIEYLEDAMRRPLEPAQELKVVYLVGSSYFKMGRNAEAMAVLDHVRMKYARTPYAANHEYFSIVTRYGEALIQAGRSGEARKALDALVAGGTRFVPAPTAAEAYYLLGVAAAKSGDAAAARSYLNIVLTTYSATPVRANAANFLRTVK